ncbi:hypothetical protein [Aquabacterium sp. J223]|uniref:hypothetical protein n=1 Tax=Aquabacterium sp. J223 TaxID=2898431 RepID=UPI0021ADFD86|nr:hypothetical protein [Aquabacterium sp. J223]UUX97963.1 hypothetical protein LRS07_21150 [Aquabacterium sp. J223]
MPLSPTKNHFAALYRTTLARSIKTGAKLQSNQQLTAACAVTHKIFSAKSKDLREALKVEGEQQGASPGQAATPQPAMAASGSRPRAPATRGAVLSHPGQVASGG